MVESQTSDTTGDTELSVVYLLARISDSPQMALIRDFFKYVSTFSTVIMSMADFLCLVFTSRVLSLLAFH